MLRIAQLSAENTRPVNLTKPAPQRLGRICSLEVDEGFTETLQLSLHRLSYLYHEQRDGSERSS
jgi:hypothetical protein